MSERQHSVLFDPQDCDSIANAVAGLLTAALGRVVKENALPSSVPGVEVFMSADGTVRVLRFYDIQRDEFKYRMDVASLPSSPEPRPLGTAPAPDAEDAGSGTGATAEQRYAEVERRTGYDFRPRS